MTDATKPSENFKDLNYLDQCRRICGHYKIHNKPDGCEEGWCVCRAIHDQYMEVVRLQKIIGPSLEKKSNESREKMSASQKTRRTRKRSG